jgi:hypothetical protein
MAYVPSFEHDVFISYAHADNTDKRVTAFRNRLVQRLTSVLGSRAFRKPEEWVFFDHLDAFCAVFGQEQLSLHRGRRFWNL